ncbi:membrane protein [Agrilactobacillus composti DSM 18527 = JCM 14202]|uniref:Membrane protein n=1 Tax=Agrilactobacillus composti DSM 18527 = JCM 14202 TaxID=1423734 RepID=X0PUZ3_9LACO|nr:acyltransferase [Agrilactobacillus composti]KRM31863.1 membrane protein [Agrilactobacillus composti DSM 18527 = JCM 14202]GAF41281.1 hypothetical protein JCM14202_3212 [Agrilactobacillus composti DSM 18527 = JCM 14202]
MDNRIQKRSSNFELLRIVSMFIIILGHYALGTNWYFATNTMFLRKEAVQFLWVGGRMGVVTFTLISGYFLAKSRFKWRSLLHNWAEVLFYSWTVLILVKIVGKPVVSPVDFVRNLFPVTFGVANWYATAYIILYFLFPFINLALKHMSKTQYRTLLVVLGITLTITQVFMLSPAAGSNGYDAVSLILIYLIGAYIRYYPEDFSPKKRWLYVGLFFLAVILSALSLLLLDYMQAHNLQYLNKTLYFGYFMDGNSPFPLIAGTCLFLFFKDLHIKHSTIINSLATTMYGVYLLHSNFFLVTPLWNWAIRGTQFHHTSQILLYGLGAALVVLLVGAVVDYIRQFLMKPVNLGLDKFAAYLEKKKLYG